MNSKKFSRSGTWFDLETIIIPPSLPRWLPIPNFRSEEVPQADIDWVAERCDEHLNSPESIYEIGGWFLISGVVETQNNSNSPEDSFGPDYSYSKGEILGLWHYHPGEYSNGFSNADYEWSETFGRPIWMYHPITKTILKYDPNTGEEDSFPWLPDDRGSGRKNGGQQQQKGQQKQKYNTDLGWLQEEQIRLLIERTKAENEKIKNETERIKLEAAREEILGKKAVIDLATTKEDFELALELAELRYQLSFDFGGNQQWQGKNSNQAMNQYQQMNRLQTGETPN